MSILGRISASLRHLDDTRIGTRMRLGLQKTWGLPLAPEVDHS